MTSNLPEIILGEFTFKWFPLSGLYDVYTGEPKGKLYPPLICRVIPYKNEYGTLGNDSKMFTVTADDYPVIGHLEQMVKGSDLLEYIESVRMGREQ